MNKKETSRLIQVLSIFLVTIFVALGCQNPLGNDTTTDEDTSSPSSISGLSYAAGNGQISVSWTDPSADDLGHIEVTWTPEDGESQPKQIDPSTESATITGLTNGTEYAFSIIAVDASGNESDSITFKDTPMASPPPAEVSNLTSAAGDTEVTLSWTDPTDSDFDHVEITWDSADGGSQPKVVSEGIESATITGLTNETTYTFTVKTVDTFANISRGSSISAKPQPSDPNAPSEVINLSANSTQTSVTLNWEEPSILDHIEITWSPNGGTPISVEPGTNTYTASGLNSGTKYTFLIQTVDSSDNTSAGKAIASATKLRIESTSPSNGASAVDPGTEDSLPSPLQVNFYKEMETSYSVLSNINTFSSNLSWFTNKTFEIQFSSPLYSSTEYIITLNPTSHSAGFVSTTGIILPRDTTVSFTTEEDTTAPTIYSSMPANGATDVSTNLEQVNIVFDDAVIQDSWSFSSDLPRIDGKDSADWVESNGININISEQLDSNTEYFITLNPDGHDFAFENGSGQYLDTNTTISFTTGS